MLGKSAVFTIKGIVGVSGTKQINENTAQQSLRNYFYSLRQKKKR